MSDRLRYRKEGGLWSCPSGDGMARARPPYFLLDLDIKILSMIFTQVLDEALGTVCALVRVP
jgi:hypothetical protein